MRYEIKRIDIWSVVKIVFLISLIGGFIISVFYGLLIGLLSAFIEPMAVDEFGGTLGMFGGFAIFFLIIFMTIFITVAYTIFAAISAALYNLMAKWAGGFTVTLQNLENPHRNTTQTSEEQVL